MPKLKAQDLPLAAREAIIRWLNRIKTRINHDTGSKTTSTPTTNRNSDSTTVRASGSSTTLVPAPQTRPSLSPPRPTKDPRSRFRPHITLYDPVLLLSGPHTICRCAFPTLHGDAFTRLHHASSSNKITFLSTTGAPISWETAAHAFLDVLGLDVRVSPGWHCEPDSLLHKVYAESTVREIKRYHEVWVGAKRNIGVGEGGLVGAVEGDVLWWGAVNPRGVRVRRGEGRVPDGSVVLSPQGPFYGIGGARRRREGTLGKRVEKDVLKKVCPWEV